MNPPKDNSQGLDEILEDLYWQGNADGGEGYGLDKRDIDERKQAILQWFADEVVQSPQTIEDMKHQYDIEKEVRHEVSEEQRNILKAHGWKDSK